MTSGFERCSYCSIFYVLVGGRTDNRLYCSLLNTDSTSLLSRYSTGQRSCHRLFVCWKYCLHGKFSTIEPSLKGYTRGLYLPSYARLSTLKWDTPCLYGLSDSLKFRLPIEKYLRHTKLLSLFFFFFTVRCGYSLPESWFGDNSLD